MSSFRVLSSAEILPSNWGRGRRGGEGGGEGRGRRGGEGEEGRGEERGEGGGGRGEGGTQIMTATFKLAKVYNNKFSTMYIHPATTVSDFYAPRNPTIHVHSNDTS